MTAFFMNHAGQFEACPSLPPPPACSEGLYSFGGYAWHGDGNDLSTSPTPVLCIGTQGTWISISSNGVRTLAINEAGELWGWGRFPVGDHTILTPTRIGSASNWAKVVVGTRHYLLLTQTGDVYGAGDGGYYAFGNNSNAHIDMLTPQFLVAGVTDIACGYTTSHVIYDGELYGCGTSASWEYRIGVPGTLFPTWTLVDDSGTWSKVASNVFSSFATKTDGTLWSWGVGEHGVLGYGSENNRPLGQVGTDTDWAELLQGHSEFVMHAIKTNGTLFGWGSNIYGELGLGDYTDRWTPVQIGSASDWVHVARGYQHTIAVNSSGQMFATGWLLSPANTLTQINNTSLWGRVACGSESVVAQRICS